MFNFKSENYDTNISLWMKKHSFPQVQLSMLKTAFTHGSFRNQSAEIEDYERLEFLGDAVLDLVVSHLLYIETSLSEGELTVERSRIVNKNNLADIYDALNMKKCIRSNLTQPLNNKIKSDFVESFMAIQWLENGFEGCIESWKRIQETLHDYNQNNSASTKRDLIRVKKLPDKQKAKQHELKELYKEIGFKQTNAKSLLQELCHYQGLTAPKYEVIAQWGDPHDMRFRVKITATLLSSEPNHIYEEIAESKSIKGAEMKAAEKLCDQIYLDYD